MIVSTPTVGRPSLPQDPRDRAASRATGLLLTPLFVLVLLVAIGAGSTSASSSTAAPSALTEFDAPAVAFDGSNYFVVWQDRRSSTEADIYGARLSPSGTVLDPNGIAISTAPGNQNSPTVAFDGTNYLVAWQDYRSGTHDEIFGARVSTGGTVLDPNGIGISTAANVEYASPPVLAFDGTNYLVAWSDYRTGIAWKVYGARVSQAGTVLDPNGVVISANGASPAIAFDGTNYLVAWSDWRSGLNDIYGARISQAGTVLDPTGIAISTAAQYQQWPAIAFDGTNYLVAWSDYRTGADIYSARVNMAGTVLDPSGILIGQGSTGPGVAFDGANYLVAWSSLGSNLYGGRVSPSGTVLDPNGFAISTAGGDQQWPALAFGAGYYLATWADLRSGTAAIYGSRVTSAGGVLDPAGIPISINPPPPPPQPPPPPAPPPPPPPPPSPPAKCRVPRVIGLKLAKAKTKIKKAHCKVGKIRRARSSKPGRVIGQSPRPGVKKPNGFKVRLVVGRR